MSDIAAVVAPVTIPVSPDGSAPPATVDVVVSSPNGVGVADPSTATTTQGASTVADPAVQIDAVSASLMHLHAANGAQRQADGAALYAENLRYDYLFQKNRVNFADSVGVRHVEESGSGRVRNLDTTIAGNKPSG